MIQYSNIYPIFLRKLYELSVLRMSNSAAPLSLTVQLKISLKLT